MPDLRVIDPDERFFQTHKDRRFHIRPAHREEFNAQFLTLGPHQINRRMVIMAVVDPLTARQIGGKLMKIPMLKNADEEISDNDDTLRPIWLEIMNNAAAQYGMNNDG